MMTLSKKNRLRTLFLMMKVRVKVRVRVKENIDYQNDFYW
jgi:hypothetical protein